MTANGNIRFMQAGSSQCADILMLIRELAFFEKQPAAVTITEADLQSALQTGLAGAYLCYLAGKPVGYAITYDTYSSFSGKKGRYLEDLYLQPSCRRQGLGRLFMSFLAKNALADGCARLDWTCLDWNEPAQAFYRSIGAETRADKILYRADAALLGQLAEDLTE